ncbi:MAG: Rieske (2Fe-2S) protein [Terriglobia bacterium]|jgi:nitrite reductase (NADH) small subunit|nr:Rieske (2Fe-2S) protein [Terriglobia bacterium]
MKLRLGSVSEMPAVGTAKEFDCGGKLCCVANVGGRLSAMDNVCPHRGGPLGTGVIDAGKLICPWHGWQFDPATGKAIHVRDAAVELYPLSVEGEDVFIEIS